VRDAINNYPRVWNSPFGVMVHGRFISFLHEKLRDCISSLQIYSVVGAETRAVFYGPAPM
jgi:hypothetical protein